jgi:hypothetical protein
MKIPARQIVALLTIAAAVFWSAESHAQFFGDTTEESGILVIHADGSCASTNVYLQPRATMEQQIRTYEKYQNAAETADEETTNAVETKESAPSKPLTDEELLKKIESFGQDSEWLSPDEKISATITTNGMVRVQMSHSFASLEELLSGASLVWQHGVAFMSERFEITNGQLRVTLTPRAQMQRYFKTIRAEMKMAGGKSELQLVFPGKVLSSSLPEKEGNMTRFVLDGKKDESLDAAMKLYGAPVVITTEAGGLKIPEPLDSKNLRHPSQRAKAGGDLPVTDAGPGFVAEPESITTTALHVFPEGKDFFKEGGGEYMSQQAGALISAKIYAPKGRTLQSINDVRILKAVDDKGRNIAGAESDSEQGEMNFSGRPQNQSASIQLGLQLPAPDAQAINEVDAEAVAVTAGTWKEMSLTNLQENATNEFDLGEILPGAKLVINKVKSQNSQTTIQATVKGPDAIQSLDFQVKIPGNEEMSSSSSDRRSSTKNGVSSRSIVIQAYTYSEKGNVGPLRLIVRHPEDLRRERVHFKLTGLDLF